MTSIEKVSEVVDKLLDPRELSYRLRNTIRRRIEKVLANEEVDCDDKKKLAELIAKEDDNKQMLDYDTLTEIHKWLQRLDTSYTMYFYEFLDECRGVTARPRQNPELEQRLRKLKQEESTKKYGSMTASIKKSQSGGDFTNVKSDMQEMRPLLIALLNSVLVVGGTFVFVFKAIEYASYEPNVNVQILGSLIVSSIVAIAEIYFLMKIL